MLRIGVDLGGTKIEVAVIDSGGNFQLRERVATPPGDYGGTVRAVCELVERARTSTGVAAPVGLGTPGSLAPSGLMQNANSTVLNGRPLIADVERRLGHPVATDNDANCLARSECAGGSAADARVSFAAILGTGVGGAVAVNGEPLQGRHRIAGEWGHNPLPWPRDDERPGPLCYCGKRGCIETWLSGPALAADYRRATGRAAGPRQVVELAAGDSDAQAAVRRYEDRLARALATVVNALDPDCIVLGGGVSNVGDLYERVPRLIGSYVFCREYRLRLRQARFGDSSGVRGAAMLGEAVKAIP